MDGDPEGTLIGCAINVTCNWGLSQKYKPQLSTSHACIDATTMASVIGSSVRAMVATAIPVMGRRAFSTTAPAQKLVAVRDALQMVILIFNDSIGRKDNIGIDVQEDLMVRRDVDKDGPCKLVVESIHRERWRPYSSCKFEDMGKCGVIKK